MLKKVLKRLYPRYLHNRCLAAMILAGSMKREKEKNPQPGAVNIRPLAANAPISRDKISRTLIIDRRRSLQRLP